MAHAEQIGLDEIIDRGVAAAANLPASIDHAGFSLGVLPAQKLAQTRPGALGALLTTKASPPPPSERPGLTTSPCRST